MPCTSRLARVGQLLTGVAAFGAWLNSLRNSRKIEQVRKSTNGLASRNEAIALKLGVREGIQQEKDHPSP